MRRTLILVALAAVCVPAAGDASAAAVDRHTINVSGDVFRVGPYRLDQGRAWTRNPPTSLANVSAKLGRVSHCRLVRNNDPTWVRARWRHRSVTGEFLTFGGVTPGQTGCTDRRRVLVSHLTATGRGWHTAKGLRIGDPVSRLRALYPDATKHHDGWWLVTATSPYGDNNDYGKFRARTRGGRVRSLTVYIGAQGD